MSPSARRIVSEVVFTTDLSGVLVRRLFEGHITDIAVLEK